MKRFGRFKRKKQNEEMALQITSMADIFTIILVFLLKTFSTGVSNVTPSADLILPESRSGIPLREMLKVEISEKNILIDDKPITRLDGFGIQDQDRESNGSPKSLNRALAREQEKENARRDPASTDPTKGARLMLMADQRTPYATLKAVMIAAANHGFGDFKLVVVGDQ